LLLVPVVAFAINDYGFFGFSWPFYGLSALRLGLLLYTTPLLNRLRGFTSYRSYLFRLAAPFQRCLRCDCLLQPMSKESISHRLPRRTAECYNDFRICPSCNRLYWAGSHHAHMQGFIARILAA
jgi:uncharacterized protein with PIN domain